jgi:hypothetical protein
MKRSAFGPFVWVTPYPTAPGTTLSRLYPHNDVTNPAQFWTERRQRQAVGTKPIRHTWNNADIDIKPALDNIAAAAHACNVSKTQWVRQCFGTAEDCCQFLEYLHGYKEHVNSYWYYALLNIAGVEEGQACDSMQLATALYEQAIRTKQLPEQASSTARFSQTSPRLPLRQKVG